MLNLGELNFAASLILVHYSAAAGPCVWRGSQGAVRSSLNLGLSEGQGGWEHCGPCFSLLLHSWLQARGLWCLFSPSHRPFSRLPSCCPWKGSRGGWCLSSLCAATCPYPAGVINRLQASSVIFGLLLCQSEYVLPFMLCLYFWRTRKPKEHHVSWKQIKQ